MPEALGCSADTDDDGTDGGDDAAADDYDGGCDVCMRLLFRKAMKSAVLFLQRIVHDIKLSPPRMFVQRGLGI